MQPITTANGNSVIPGQPASPGIAAKSISSNVKAQYQASLLFVPSELILSILHFLDRDSLCSIQLLNRRGYRLLDCGSVNNLTLKHCKIFEEFILGKIVLIRPKVVFSLPIDFNLEIDLKLATERAPITKISNSQRNFVLKGTEIIASDKTDSNKELWRCTLDHHGTKEFFASNDQWIIISSIDQNSHGSRTYDEKYSAIDCKTGEIFPIHRQRGNNKLSGWLLGNIFAYVTRDGNVHCCYLSSQNKFFLFKLKSGHEVKDIALPENEIQVHLTSKEGLRTQDRILKFSLTHYKREQIGKPLATKLVTSILGNANSPSFGPQKGVTLPDLPSLESVTSISTTTFRARITLSFFAKK